MNQGAVGPAGGGRLKDSLKNLPTFDESRDSSFRIHLNLLSQFYHINEIESDDQRKLALLHSLRGKSAERVMHIGLESDIFRTTLLFQDYKNVVKNIFIPEAEQELAKSEFLLRKQGLREDIGAYLTAKNALFVTAFGNNGPYSTLLTETIKGLANTVVKRQVRRSNPRSYDELRSCAFQVVASERMAYLEGYGESQSLDGLAAVTSTIEAASKPNYSLGEPMEIGNIQQFHASNSGRRQQTGKHDRKETRDCKKCGRRGHLAANCRSNMNSNKAKPTANKNQDNKTCRYCLKAGHWERNCYAKQQGKPRASPGGQNKVHQVTEEVSWGDIGEEEANLLAQSIQQISSLKQGN